MSARGWLHSCCVFNTWAASLLIPGRCYISLLLSLFQGGFQPSSPAPAKAAGYACMHVPGRRLRGAGFRLPLHLCSQSHPKPRSGGSVVAPGPLAVTAPSTSPGSCCAGLGPAVVAGQGAGAQLAVQVGGMQGRNWVNFGVTSLRLPWGSVSKMMQRNSPCVSQQLFQPLELWCSSWLGPEKSAGEQLMWACRSPDFPPRK